VIEDIGKPVEDTEYVYVCDRGADNFEVFCHLRQQNSDWVIRAKAKNRKLLTVDDEDITLGDLLERLTVCGQYELQLRARPGQAARTAQIEVSSGQASMPVPRQKSAWIRLLDPEPIAVNVVRLLQMKTLANADPDRPARKVIPLLWLQMLKAVRGKPQRVHDLTIYEFYREVTKLGGFLGGKSDGEPGWITVWRGWEKLNNLVRGVRIALDLQPNTCG
jgi:hypothetical protein